MNRNKYNSIAAFLLEGFRGTTLSATLTVYVLSILVLAPLSLLLLRVTKETAALSMLPFAIIGGIVVEYIFLKRAALNCLHPMADISEPDLSATDLTETTIGEPSTALPRLNAADLQALQSILPQFSYEKGKRIFQYGDPGDSIYFIVSGKVHFFQIRATGKELMVEAAGEGAFFGEVAMLQGGKRTASAKAMEPTLLLKLHSEQLDVLFQRHPHVARLLMKGLSQRLIRSGEQLRSITILDADKVADEELTTQNKRLTRLTFVGT